jgi:hypothetical protein
VLALRFDMDALPVAETEAEAHRPNEGGFRSATVGQMHACAHDGPPPSASPWPNSSPTKLRVGMER